MGYTGNLVRLAAKPGALALSPPSPRHGTVEGASTTSLQQQTVTSGTGSEFQGTDFDEVMVSGGGMVLDTPATSSITPPGGIYESPYHITYPNGNPHTSDAVLSLYGANAQAGGAGAPDSCMIADTSMTGRAHSGTRDRGWIRSLFNPAPLFRDETPHTTITPEGPGSSVEGPAGEGGQKYGRGINALGINNPSGFRHGRYQLNVSSNENYSQIRREIGVQYIAPKEVYTPGPQQRMVSSMITPPSLPRDAPNPNDVLYASSDYSSSAASVFGGF